MTALRLTSAPLIALALLAGAAPVAEAKLETSFSGRVLNIVGDNGDDQVAVRCAAEATVKVNGANPKGGPLACSRVVEINATTGGGNDVVDFGGVTDAFGEANFPGFGKGTGAAAVLGAGNDRYIPSADAFNLVYGEDGKDRIRGGPRRDLLSGGSGNDVIHGGAGRDTLLGNGGDDKLFGEEGADTITGGGGNDRLVGGPGADFLGGGAGRDKLFGGPGNDKLVGGPGADILRGGSGKNKLIQDPPKAKKP